jgi:phage tail sheath protein FI
MSSFQVSAGVNVSEIDLTSSIPAISVSTGAIAGLFSWGPVEKIVSVSTEVDLVNKLDAPNDNNAITFLTAASFLSYSNDLLVVRSSANGQLNSVATANANANVVVSGVLVKNEDAYFNNEYVTGIANVAFIAKYAGALGNSLQVSVCPSATAFASWAYSSAFDSAPSTSVYVAAQGGANDEMHMVVVDQDGLFTGTANTILERYSHISKAVDAKDDTGASSYYKEVLYRQSLYVYFSSTIANDAVTGTNTTNWGGVSTSTFGAGNTYTVSFTGGADGTPVTANIESAYALFANPEYVDISLIMTGGADQTVSEYVVDLAGSRMDCLAFVSPSLAATQNTSGPAAAIAAYRNAMTSSSYAVMDSGWKYMYDKYNDKYRWVPLNGDIAGLCARTDNQRDPWFSPAGYQRGVIKNVIKLAFNPNKQDRDTLYKAGINPVVAFPGEGTILYGDKTLLARPSSFDRINVRRLFIVLEKAISRAAKASLFEFNDEFTRAAFVNLVEPFLRTVQGRRGIYDFRVVCDTTNNTPDVIDANQFVGDIYIKPARSVNFIQLNFVAVRTGVAFEEIVGHF